MLHLWVSVQVGYAAQQVEHSIIAQVAPAAWVAAEAGGDTAAAASLHMSTAIAHEAKQMVHSFAATDIAIVVGPQQAHAMRDALGILRGTAGYLAAA